MPEQPTMFVIVKLPAGTKRRTGTVSKVWDDSYKWGNGGGIQYEILNWDKQLMDDWFKKIGDL